MVCLTSVVKVTVAAVLNWPERSLLFPPSLRISARVMAVSSARHSFLHMNDAREASNIDHVIAN